MNAPWKTSVLQLACGSPGRSTILDTTDSAGRRTTLLVSALMTTMDRRIYIR